MLSVENFNSDCFLLLPCTGHSYCPCLGTPLFLDWVSCLINSWFQHCFRSIESSWNSSKWYENLFHIFTVVSQIFTLGLREEIGFPSYIYVPSVVFFLFSLTTILVLLLFNSEYFEWLILYIYVKPLHLLSFVLAM